ncbi:MAG: YicC/YloC family endoribonuclease [Bacteroidota bacterium]
MQHSMTGYGCNERKCQQFLIKSEVKTLNSKFLDFSPRLPKELTSKENQVRNLVNEKLKRGKVMLALDLEIDANDTSAVKVDEKLFKAYYDTFRSLASKVNAQEENLLKLALEAPQVIKQQELSEHEIPWDEVEKSIINSLDECIKFRMQEGEVLSKKLKGYIRNIEEGLSMIDSADKKRDESIRSKIQKGIDEIRDKVKVDENRFEQELIFYLERLDISEEKVRLNQHLSYFLEILEKESYAGKKLGFISQEIGREINTIGSKANDAEIQRTVVSMKDELEKIKEQVLNLI